MIGKIRIIPKWIHDKLIRRGSAHGPADQITSKRGIKPVGPAGTDVEARKTGSEPRHEKRRPKIPGKGDHFDIEI